MTQEEKARRYDEILEKAKSWYIDAQIDFKKSLETLFPELKESEGERIRKWLIDTIKAVPNNSIEWEKIDKLDVLAWLEKQGEQNLVEFKPSFRVGNVIKPKDPVLGEPRIIKGIHPKFGYDTNNGILDFEFEDNWELVEQKSADKAEPKFKIGDKIQYLKGCGTIMTIEKIENGEYIFGNNLGHITIESGNKWHLIEQNPSWSEEDENLLKLSLENLTELKNRFGKEYGKVGDCIDWLKSLKPQNHWKPSNEQMKTLSKYADQNNIDGHIMTTLYRDLKKLTEQKL